MFRAMATGTEVNKAVTSYDVMPSPSPSVVSLICSIKAMCSVYGAVIFLQGV